MLTYEEIVNAREQMKGVIHETPLDYSNTFSSLSHNKIYLKLENMQKTGSFKVRGAYNKIISLTKKQREKGIIAASAGNHAQGVAFACRMLAIPCTIVMPKGAPLSKIEATKSYGATVELSGHSFDDALAEALIIKEQTEATFVHAFDDDAIIAGQGTIGLEIIEQLPDVDAIVCPIGGGGLIAGLAKAIKETHPHVKVYGVQASSCNSMGQSIDRKQPTLIDALPTMADGIAVKKPGQKPYDIVEKYVDDLFIVEETELAKTMLLLLERNKLVVEGSGATALAALMYEKIPIKDKKVVAILSGGNVDVSFVSKVIEYGLMESGRYLTFRTLIEDKPGKLPEILGKISELEANILNVNQQRVGVKVFPGQTQLQVSLETRDPEHIKQILEKLRKAGYDIDELS
ncbi:threonine ammonia-lyase [Salipaludibacillus daqingensis]|uniref:threonine ammonia-lyase n=1 Tax=Salipaludibacillus daqingensis TaxID=3041001 RepID=UPI002474B679|nr:threonine ammonia-lyase [Salipaludibacillus daqingensis]